MTARFVIGDTRKALAAMPDASVDLVISSPPFLALRSYLPADHPDKGSEIGSEGSPGEFLDVLLDVVEECARVLTAHGSLVFELGDTYSGAGGGEDSARFRTGYDRRDGRKVMQQVDYGAPLPSAKTARHDGWPLDKSLCLIPQSFAWALSYGRNPFTGRETGRWRVRNVVAWCRPNPPVGALGDKFRPGTSYLTVACKSRTRWFDLDAVRVPTDCDKPGGLRQGTPHGTDERRARDGERSNMSGSNPAGAPPLDWWEIPTQPYAGAHYATWPERLLVKPILAMCPERVCNVCGEPSRRITERSEEYAAARERVGDFNRRAEGPGSSGPRTQQLGKMTAAENITVGWSDCGHNDWRRGVVLDPFVGSGTTLAVAEGHGRDSIGIDLDARNAVLASERVGMWLSVETPDAVLTGFQNEEGDE